MAESYPNGLKILWEQKKLLFFHSVFKRHTGLVWERVKGRQRYVLNQRKKKSPA